MRYLFELSGEHQFLPLWEAEAILNYFGKAELCEKEDCVAVFSSKIEKTDFLERIALSHVLCEHIATVSLSELQDSLDKLTVLDNKNVAIRVKLLSSKKGKLDSISLAKEIGGMISDRAKVDFRNPDIRIRIYVGEKIYICSESAQIDRSQYEKRKNRLLPFTSPISIHPRLARALINITSKKGDRNVLDPFCGTGTFLIEARLLGFQTFGSDISDRMIKGSRRNLDHLRLRANLRQCDIGEISGFKKKFDCIVTDPPYGRSSSTNKESISSLYSRAVEAFSDNLKEKGRVGIIVPRMDMLDYKKYFKMVKSTSIRVHRSLVRNFVVLEKE